MQKSYVAPEMICVTLTAPTLLAGSPTGTHNEVSTSPELSRGIDWENDEY